ncbi:uncharacterized protein LOC129580029 [Sitodiplosis mosellana]|uniref:uncharacterized protein LOC129580029 n=1 Tax=Sitodiplosis mosellana TaxID=263140 RepID=UPI0024437883|nr:uncharacterized protein LOC129580029 [Sitodiplosis mosellana]
MKEDIERPHHFSSAENDEHVTNSVKRRSPSELEDKIQHEDSNYTKIQTEFDDMCDDAIEKILSYLELVDLTNICGVSRRLQTIAKSIFSRKHGHWLICIDATQFPIERFDPLSVYCKIKPIIRISEAKMWFKLIRNFGKSIKYIQIETDSVFIDKGIKPSFYKYIIEYIIEYSADSLEVIELLNYPFMPLNKPLKNLTKIIALSDEHIKFDAIEYIPNVNSLWLKWIPKILKNICFPNMNELKTSDQDVESFISFLRVNRQIKKLRVIIHSDSDLILSSISEILPKLKTLKIVFSCSLRRLSMEKIPFYQFKSVENFSMKSDYHYIGSFVFDNLKRLSLGIEDGNSDWLNAAIRMKKLKILKLTHASMLIKNYQILLTKLTELELIIVRFSKQHESNVLIQSLGREWKQVQMEKIDCLYDTYKVKFQRKR